jgi:hypothetical protein
MLRCVVGKGLASTDREWTGRGNLWPPACCSARFVLVAPAIFDSTGGCTTRGAFEGPAARGNASFAAGSCRRKMLPVLLELRRDALTRTLGSTHFSHEEEPPSLPSPLWTMSSKAAERPFGLASCGTFGGFVCSGS